ncbi:MAG TPA: YbaB/EbfC family nucleoid-associated protein [Acidimicrobiales bacterium]|nr:YbaB/EbfC family nucleoid-associated protein [Acidimicrobiales bacterium]
MTIDDPGESGPSFDLGDLFSQMQRMQDELTNASAHTAEEVVEGTSGGGAVRVSVTGDLQFQAVSIDRGVVDPDDVSMLEDLVLAALHDAVDKVAALNQDAMGQMGALGMSGLPDLNDIARLAGSIDFGQLARITELGGMTDLLAGADDSGWDENDWGTDEHSEPGDGEGEGEGHKASGEEQASDNG